MFAGGLIFGHPHVGAEISTVCGLQLLPEFENVKVTPCAIGILVIVKEPPPLETTVPAVVSTW